MNRANTFRILAIALTSRGFGYAVLEGKDLLIKAGAKGIVGDRNARSLARVENMIIRFRPDVLVLYDVNAEGAYRHKRIKVLHRQVVSLAKTRKLNTKTISAAVLREVLVGVPKATKQEVAELLAKRFPDELASHLPPKRRRWESENRWMDMFDAVALAVAI